MRAMSDTVLLDIADRIATITLNRPDKRNALSRELLGTLPQVMKAAESDPDVDVLILTGADPAFSAGLDLKELGSSESLLAAATGADGSVNADGIRGPFPPLTKPLIGAVNGVAVTGGFELALNCDFLIASEHARFADTHARIGVMPGWGLSVLLPERIGVTRARQMSLTGNYVDAALALQWGLVNEVVAHGDLLARCRQLATDIIGNDQPGVRQMKATYAENSYDAAGWDIEARNARAWRKSGNSNPDQVAERRAGVMARGRSQVS
jgi:enoyl-CoA hydratase